MADIELDDADLQPIEGDEAPASEGKASLDDVISKALDGADINDDAPARERDEQGRFKAKDSEAVTEAPDTGTSEAQPAVASTETNPQDAKPEISEGHFRGWAPEQVAAFKALPPEAQKIALEVVQGRDRYYSERLSEADQYLRATVPLATAVQPHLARIQTVTNDPSAYVAHVLDVDHRLQFAPYAEKVKLLTELASNVGIPIAVQQPDPFMPDPTQLGGEAYPVVHDLKNQVHQLQAQLNQFRIQHETVQQQQTTEFVHSFASQTNADGSPKYPHFETVRHAMGQLLDAGRVHSMDEAYAIAAKPIEEAIAKRIAAQTRQTQAASQAALDKARKARPVVRTGMASGGKTKGGGLDAIIGSALDGAGFN